MMNLASSVVAQYSGWVGCNIYVSAGGHHQHKSLLLRLLQLAQRDCLDHSWNPTNTSLRSNNMPTAESSLSNVVVVVHAYADPIYNRSSFHLAGTAPQVAQVASFLAVQAMQELSTASSSDQQTSHEEESHAHPFVGLVDHVSVMPLVVEDDNQTANGGDAGEARELPDKQDDTTSTAEFVPTTPSGWAARCIGEAMEPHVQGVYYYGTAHPHGMSLAQVRREKTRFFQSGGLHEGNDTVQETTTNNLTKKKKSSLSSNHQPARSNIATVGAPLEFVENYNLRLYPQDATTTGVTTKQLAHSLTRHLRGRNPGGLPGVEALSLPYANQQWEVACNLLQPSMANADQVHQHALQWEHAQQQHMRVTKPMIETGYRVGTTATQCIEVLERLTPPPSLGARHDTRDTNGTGNEKDVDVAKESSLLTRDDLVERRRLYDEEVRARLGNYLKENEEAFRD